MPQKWLSIIGIGEDGYAGLSSVARSLIDSAEILVGGNRHLAMIKSDHRLRLAWKYPFSANIQQILEYQGKSVCVLASGDPMWYGIGATLIRQIPAEYLEQITIVPNISVFSLMCARLGWSMTEVETLSLCGRSADLLRAYIYPNAKLLVLSANQNTPAIVAKILADSGFGHSKIWVLEHLGGTKERIISSIADAWDANAEIADLNAIAIECCASSEIFPKLNFESSSETKFFARVAGLPDYAYNHDGQLTKHEVRAVTLCALAPSAGELLWDVGAGCGSIGIEWMRSHPRCRAITIEKSRIAYIADNAASLGTPNLEIIHGIAPAALENLPIPDAIFIGGGITTSGMIETCWERLRAPGRLVANVVTIEGEQILYKWQQKLGGTLTRIAIERAETVGNFWGWKPMMPVTQWFVRKSISK